MRTLFVVMGVYILDMFNYNRRFL